MKEVELFLAVDQQNSMALEDISLHMQKIYEIAKQEGILQLEWYDDVTNEYNNIPLYHKCLRLILIGMDPAHEEFKRIYHKAETCSDFGKIILKGFDKIWGLVTQKGEI
ncbi:hypothetical protein FACS189473_2480 [Spirochaetia bacterium]|nr:hypothetical protein FACS189473_2480 [Spirochaetia bacterium]